MLTFHSFLQEICRRMKTWKAGGGKFTRKLYRSIAVFMTGAAVITAMTFTPGSFGGSGSGALTAFAETQTPNAADETPEETETITEAKVQVESTDSKKQGQVLVGDLLEKEVQQQQKKSEIAKAELEKIKNDILTEAQEKVAQQVEAAAQSEKTVSSAISYSEKDYNVLLRIVQAEAGICDAKGKILVANVIINRVKSGQFPNSITGVVYQPSQFSPVSNGSINSVRVTQETKDCVNRALAGEDYSQGALYFMNRSGSRSRAVRWFDSHLTYLFRHENHEFFR